MIGLNEGVGKPVALTFEQRYTEISSWVDKRRRSIDLATLPWDDIRQLVLIRVSQQYASFDEAKGPFSHWVNRVITNALRNIYRDWYSTAARPCVTGKGGCSENMGGNLCRRTASGVQCRECPAYREWEHRKGDQYAIMHPVPLEMPGNDGKASAMERPEAHSTQADYIDYPEKQKQLHARMKERLTRVEWRAYRMLIILHKSEEEVGKALGFKHKAGKRQRMFPGYLAVLSLRHKFINLARQILAEEDLAA